MMGVVVWRRVHLFLFIKKTMIDEDEADARNHVLVTIYKRIPSYALWAPSDIARETREVRIDWWKTFLTHSSVSPTARHWVAAIRASKKKK